MLVKNIGFWKLAGAVAGRLHDENRVFLAGDSAHTFPPSGGFGLNTGLQDVHNLIHKLACPSERVGEEYEAERQPIARENLEQSMTNLEASFGMARSLGLDYENL